MTDPLNREQYEVALNLVALLVPDDPPAQTRKGEALVALAILVEQYEKEHISFLDTKPETHRP